MAGSRATDVVAVVLLLLAAAVALVEIAWQPRWIYSRWMVVVVWWLFSLFLGFGSLLVDLQLESIDFAAFFNFFFHVDASRL